MAPMAVATDPAPPVVGADRRAATGEGRGPRFDKSPAKGVERATVGYHRVRISSEPDELRSEELGRLDRGDEVEIVGLVRGFLQVRTPDGIVGWILDT